MPDNTDPAPDQSSAPAAPAAPTLTSMPLEVLEAIVRALLRSRDAADTVAAARFSFSNKAILEASRGAWLSKPSTERTEDVINDTLEEIHRCECGEPVWEDFRIFCYDDCCDWGCENCISDVQCATCDRCSFCMDDGRCEKCWRDEERKAEREAAQREREARGYNSDDDDSDQDGPVCDCGELAAIACRQQKCYHCCDSTRCQRHNGPRERF